jgi:hypothetical protein
MLPELHSVGAGVIFYRRDLGEGLIYTLVEKRPKRVELYLYKIR